MTKLSVLEDAKVKIAAYDNVGMYDCWSDEIVHKLLNTIKELVEELESKQKENQRLWDAFEKAVKERTNNNEYR